MLDTPLIGTPCHKYIPTCTNFHAAPILDYETQRACHIHKPSRWTIVLTPNSHRGPHQIQLADLCNFFCLCALLLDGG
jgi:hypothetical protein